MNLTRRLDLLLCLAAVVLCGAVIGSAWFSQGNVLSQVQQSGSLAFKAGVPANANPWVGRDAIAANCWLEGWMAAKKQENQ